MLNWVSWIVCLQIALLALLDIRMPVSDHRSANASRSKRTIGLDFRWRVHSQDTPSHRQMIASLILDMIKRHSGVFPESDAFVERAHRTAKAEHPGQDLSREDAWKRVTREVCCPREQRQAWPPCSRVAVIFAMTVPDVTGPRNVGYQWWRGGEQDQRRNGSRRSFSGNNFNARRGLRIRWSSIGTEHVSS